METNDDFLDNNALKVLYNMQSICEKIVEDTYAEYQLDLQLPIDICKVASHLGIQLSRDRLNYWDDDFVQYVTNIQSYENKSESNIKKTTIDTRFKEYSNLDCYDWNLYSNYELFGIAREIARFIIDDGQQAMKPFQLFKHFDMNPLCSSIGLESKDINFSYEICAILLLLPKDLFFDAFAKYIDWNGRHPKHLEKWIRYLESISNIPYGVLVNNYVALKSVFCALYQMDAEKIGEQFILKFYT